MAASDRNAARSEDREFVITRVFDAPRALMFKVWTEPKHVAQWWGPHQFTNPICEMDVRPGGAFRIVMRGPDGSDHPARGHYREVTPPERLVFTLDHSELSDEWHDMVNPGRDKSKGKPALLAVTTVTFLENDGKTTLTIQMQFESDAIRDAFLKIGMTEGWSQSLERLGAELGHAKMGEKP